MSGSPGLTHASWRPQARGRPLLRQPRHRRSRICAIERDARTADGEAITTPERGQTMKKYLVAAALAVVAIIPTAVPAVASADVPAGPVAKLIDKQFSTQINRRAKSAGLTAKNIAVKCKDLGGGTYLCRGTFTLTMPKTGMHVRYAWPIMAGGPLLRWHTDGPAILLRVW
jgi:hypothetical protein